MDTEVLKVTHTSRFVSQIIIYKLRHSASEPLLKYLVDIQFRSRCKERKLWYKAEKVIFFETMIKVWYLGTNLLGKKLQWVTKVLRHFCKMAPFYVVDIRIPFPYLPQPLATKANVVYWTLKSFFYFRHHWFGGWGDLRRLKGTKS